MKNWLSNNSKLKRWILVILIGMILFCFSISKILVLNEIALKDILEIVGSFTLGFVMIVYGLVHYSKRTIELEIESSDERLSGKKNVNMKNIIYNKNIFEKRPRIVVIGGGSGINSVLEGLKKYTSNICAIIDTSDYGADETFSRKALKQLPLTDIRDSLIALAPKSEKMSKVLKYKFDETSKLNGLEFSDIFFSALNKNCNNIVEAIKECGDILNITGKVLPVTQEQMNIICELDNGMVIDEKDKIEKIVYERFTKINRVLLNPANIKPAPGVLEEIKKADAIVIGPGALYTNVIPNLLVLNVAKAIKESKALKIYVANIMTTPGQTDNYSLKDHIRAIIDHSGNILDYCIYDTGEVEPKAIKKYNMNGQDLISQEKGDFKGIKFIKKDLSEVKNGYIRHDPSKIAQAIIEVVCEDLKYKDKMQDPQYLMLQNVLTQEKKISRSNKRRKMKKKLTKNKKVLNKKSKFGQKYDERIKSMQEADQGLKKQEKPKQTNTKTNNVKTRNPNSQSVQKMKKRNKDKIIG